MNMNVGGKDSGNAVVEGVRGKEDTGQEIGCGTNANYTRDVRSPGNEVVMVWTYADKRGCLFIMEGAMGIERRRRGRRRGGGWTVCALISCRRDFRERKLPDGLETNTCISVHRPRLNVGRR